jgi:uncharacterized membrane protein YeiB
MRPWRGAGWGVRRPAGASPPSPRPADPRPAVRSPEVATGPPARLAGVDLARGVALLGMMAAHVFDTFSDDGTPTAATVIAGGRSAATFALVAGVSLAFLSGGRRAVEGRARTAARAGIAVRAVLIGSVGLAIGEVSPEAVILTFYAGLFLLALPLLGLRFAALVGVAAALVVVAPLVLFAAAQVDLPSFDGDSPTVATLVGEPVGLVVGLLVTGYYPAIAYLAYICAGLAVGRLDLSCPRSAWRLLAWGSGLAVTAWAVSTLLLFRLGGLAHLADAAPSRLRGDAATSRILWDPDETGSWWWFALRAPHSGTPLDLLHTIGAALAVLGAALLLARVPVLARLLRPVAAAGSMALTLYTAHLLVLATGVLDDAPWVGYGLLVVPALAFATLWRRRRGPGPLEAIVSAAARRARRAVLARTG